MLRDLLASGDAPRRAFMLALVLARLTAALRLQFAYRPEAEELWEEYERFAHRWASSVGIAAGYERFTLEAGDMLDSLERFLRDRRRAA